MNRERRTCDEKDDPAILKLLKPYDYLLFVLLVVGSFYRFSI